MLQPWTYKNLKNCLCFFVKYNKIVFLSSENFKLKLKKCLWRWMWDAIIKLTHPSAKEHFQKTSFDTKNRRQTSGQNIPTTTAHRSLSHLWMKISWLRKNKVRNGPAVCGALITIHSPLVFALRDYVSLCVSVCVLIAVGMGELKYMAAMNERFVCAKGKWMNAAVCRVCLRSFLVALVCW